MIFFCSYLVTIGEDIGKVKNIFPDISSWRWLPDTLSRVFPPARSNTQG